MDTQSDFWQRIKPKAKSTLGTEEGGAKVDTILQRIFASYHFNALLGARAALNTTETNLEVLRLASTLTILEQGYQRIRLSEVGDAYEDMPWDKFIRLVDRSGFEVFFHDQIDHSLEQERVHFHELIAAHRDKRLILHAYSFTYPEREDGPREILDVARLFGAIRYDQNTKAQVDLMPKSWKDTIHLVGLPHFFTINVVKYGLTSPLLYLEQLSQFCDWAHHNSSLHFTSELVAGSEDFKEERRDVLLELAPDWVHLFMESDYGQINSAIALAAEQARQTFDQNEPDE